MILVVVTLLMACQNGKRNESGNDSDGITAATVQAGQSQPQANALKSTEQELAQVDSTLEVVKREHDSLYQWVMNHATELTEQSPEVIRLTQLRITLDSLKVRFDVLCHRIKTIHREQNEE